jgi:hypothetical protein
VSLTPDERARYDARKARMRAVLAANPPQERGPDFAEGLRQDIEFLREQRMRANAMLLDDEDDGYTPMRWWNVIRQVRAHCGALGHIWVHNGPLWWLCSTCRSWRREDRL